MKQQLERVLLFLNNLSMGSYPGREEHDTAISILQTVIENDGKLKETISDISYLAGVDRYYSGNSREDVQHFIHLAEKFESEVSYHEGENEGDLPDYMEAVEDFYKENVKAVKKLGFNYPAGAKSEWDNIEIAGCKDDGESTYRLDDKDETPDFYTVYLHLTEGGTMAVADLPSEKEANEIAELIQNAVITFKDNGYMALHRNGEAHRKFNLFIDERIHMAHSSQTKAAYEVVKEYFNKLIKP